MTKIKRIEKELDKLREEREKIVAEATKENAKKFNELQEELKLAKEELATRFIGKCYKVKDREVGIISMGGLPKCWDKYFKIVGTKIESDSYIVIEFSKTPYGNIRIDKTKHLFHYVSDLLKLGMATEIGQLEFDKEFNELIGELK